MQKKFIYYFCLIIMLATNKTGECKSLISSSNCIIGNKNANKSNIITVGTIGSQCSSACNTYCSAQFKITEISSDASPTNTNNSQTDINRVRDGVLQVNQDRIEQCLKDCYNGLTTNTKIKIPIQTNNNGNTYNDFGDKLEPWVCDVYPGTDVKNVLDLSCKDKATSNASGGNVCSGTELLQSYSDGNISLSQGQKVIISTVDYNTQKDDNSNTLIDINGNNIYLCGFKTVMFSPIYYAHGDKNIDKVYQGSTAQLFDSKTHIGMNTMNTDVFVKNQDYLSIQYMGKYFSNCLDKNTCITNDIRDYKIFMMIGSSTGQIPLQFNIPPIQVKDYSTAKQSEIAQNANCQNCINNPNDSACMTAACGYIKPDTETIYGLQTSVNWLNSPKLFTAQLGNYDSESQFRSTTISGILDGLPETSSPLHISYTGSKNPKGGYFVSMTWRGCHYTDGQRLEYTVFNDSILNSKLFSQYINAYAEWKDLVFSDVNGINVAEVTINEGDLALPSALSIAEEDIVISNDHKKARIYFRIKTLSSTEAQAMGATDFARSDTIGQYYLKLEKPIDDSIILSFIEKFEKFLDKVTEKVFQGFTTNKTFISIIKVLLILYIALIGMMFMSGIATLNQTEGIIRVFKIAIVLLLLSDTSFAFFNDYLLKFFSFETMNTFANIFTTRIDIDVAADITNNSSQLCAEDPKQKVYLLCVLQQDLRMFFSWSFWNRMFGLIISGFFIPAIAISIGIFMYITIIIKIVFLYCIAMLALTVTLALSPIFIPLILFKYTKSIFDNWLKQLMVTLFQPVFIFTAISIFRIVFLVLIETFMGTSACQICWLEFSLPFGTYCFLSAYFYVPLSLGSSAGVFSIPMSNVGLLMSLYFIAAGMNSLCTFSYTLSTRFFSFHGFAVSSNSTSPSAMLQQFKQSSGVLSSIAKAPLKVLAIDDKSRADRKAMRSKMYNKHAENERKKQAAAAKQPGPAAKQPGPAANQSVGGGGVKQSVDESQQNQGAAASQDNDPQNQHPAIVNPDDEVPQGNGVVNRAVDESQQVQDAAASQDNDPQNQDAGVVNQPVVNPDDAQNQAVDESQPHKGPNDDKSIK